VAARVAAAALLGFALMRYQISDSEHPYDVEIEEIDGQTYDIRVGERPAVRVHAHKTPRTGYSLLIDGRQYEGSVDEGEGGRFVVQVGSSAFGFKVVDPRSRLFAGVDSRIASGRQELRAQMPGKIVKLLVRTGDSVRAEQPLVVIEAMKMENELKTPADGVVSEIRVAEGDAVDTHALLLVVDPAEPAA
jgi:biotin carboxyl carrier protein